MHRGAENDSSNKSHDNLKPFQQHT